MIIVNIKKPTDLKEGQIIELKWEYFDHDMEHFEPRLLRMVLIERSESPWQDAMAKPNGWKVKVIYDSNMKGHRKNKVPYDNMYFDTWIQMSINQNKLKVIS